MSLITIHIKNYTKLNAFNQFLLNDGNSNTSNKLACRIYKVLSNACIYLFFTRLSSGRNYHVWFANEKTEKLAGFSFLNHIGLPKESTVFNLWMKIKCQQSIILKLNCMFRIWKVAIVKHLYHKSKYRKTALISQLRSSSWPTIEELWEITTLG